MKPTKAQRAILARMAEGAVIVHADDRRWVLKQENDVLREVSKPMRRRLRQAQWTRQDWVSLCYRITDAGRVALLVTPPAELAATGGREEVA